MDHEVRIDLAQNNLDPDSEPVYYYYFRILICLEKNHHTAVRSSEPIDESTSY